MKQTKKKILWFSLISAFLESTESEHTRGTFKYHDYLWICRSLVRAAPYLQRLYIFTLYWMAFRALTRKVMRYGVWESTAWTGVSCLYISNIVPGRLTERDWCTEPKYLLPSLSVFQSFQCLASLQKSLIAILAIIEILRFKTSYLRF